LQNKSTEHQEQVALVTWFRIRFPLLRMALFAIPNGGLRHIKVAMTLKAEGVIAGVSDLFLMVPRGTYHGCFIEMKTLKGKLSANQKEFIKIAKNMGYETIVGYGYEDARDKIKKYMEIN